jgi:hypothetical protein
MGGYLMISLILAIGLFTAVQNKLTKALSIIAIPLISYVILFNLSRTTYFSTLTALFVFFMLKNKKLIVVPIICMVVLFLIIPTILPNTVLGKRVGNITQDIFSLRTKPIDQFDSLTLHRAKFIDVFKDFPAHFVFGKGLGFYPLHAYDSQISLVPVSTGIIGSIVFVWLLSEILKFAIRAYKSVYDVELKSLTTGFIAIYFGVLVHSIITTAFMIALIAYPFWLLLAMAAVSAKIISKDGSPESVS